jgi:hypothetical protein
VRLFVVLAGLLFVVGVACDSKSDQSKSEPTTEAATEPQTAATQPPTVPTTANPCPFFSCVPVTRPPAPAPQPTVGSPGGCNPNYTPCVPNDPVDVDCAGGSGDGPSYVRGPVRVIGTDVYGLDRDGDGIGCDS